MACLSVGNRGQIDFPVADWNDTDDMFLLWSLNGCHLYSYDIDNQTEYINECRNQINHPEIVFRRKGHQAVVKGKQNEQMNAGKYDYQLGFQHTGGSEVEVESFQEIPV